VRLLRSSKDGNVRGIWAAERSHCPWDETPHHPRMPGLARIEGMFLCRVNGLKYE
jgi:hypothetical protein